MAQNVACKTVTDVKTLMGGTAGWFDDNDKMTMDHFVQVLEYVMYISLLGHEEKALVYKKKIEYQPE